MSYLPNQMNYLNLSGRWTLPQLVLREPQHSPQLAGSLRCRSLTCLWGPHCRRLPRYQSQSRRWGLSHRP
jgi:hypothetical protein